MEERVPKSEGENFGARVGGIFRRLLDVLEAKYLITKRDRDYIIGEISEAEYFDTNTANKLSCSSCDQFGIGCGDCEVSDDD